MIKIMTSVWRDYMDENTRQRKVGEFPLRIERIPLGRQPLKGLKIQDKERVNL